MDDLFVFEGASQQAADATASAAEHASCHMLAPRRKISLPDCSGDRTELFTKLRGLIVPVLWHRSTSMCQLGLSRTSLFHFLGMREMFSKPRARGDQSFFFIVILFFMSIERFGSAGLRASE